MPTYIRDKTKGAIYFFTLVSFNRRKIFCSPTFLSAFKKSIQKIRKQHPFRVIAWVQLPDHLHCIWQLPENDDNFSIRWAKIKLNTTKLIPELHLSNDSLSQSNQNRNEKGIWQRRFYEHKIRDEQDFINHMNYIHYNPVKHKLVSSVVDWQFSSFHRLIDAGFYAKNWGTSDLILPDNFAKNVE